VASDGPDSAAIASRAFSIALLLSVRGINKTGVEIGREVKNVVMKVPLAANWWLLWMGYGDTCKRRYLLLHAARRIEWLQGAGAIQKPIRRLAT
jgi:hypothetical protein